MSSCSVVKEGAAAFNGKSHNIGINSSISGEIFLIHMWTTEEIMMPYDRLILQGSDTNPDSRIHGINHTPTL